MKAICVLFLLFLSSIAMAQDSLYLSYLTNGSQITLNVAKLRSNFTVEQTITKTLSSAGGLTAMMPGSQANQMFVFYNQRQTANGPIKIMRETISTAPFQFVGESTKVLPLNSKSFLNFDVSAGFEDQSQTSKTYTSFSKTTNTIGLREVNSTGNIGANFGTTRPLPGIPFSTKIVTYFDENLGNAAVNQQTNVATVTLQDTANGNRLGTFLYWVNQYGVTYEFTGEDKPEAAEVDEASDYVGPRPSRASGLVNKAADEPVIFFAYRGLIAGNPFPRAGTYVRALTAKTFTPLGNVITIDPPKEHRNAGSIRFNMIASSHRSQGSTLLDFVFDRFNTGTNTNDLWARSISGTTLKPMGPAKPVFRGKSGSVIYGLDLMRN